MSFDNGLSSLKCQVLYEQPFQKIRNDRCQNAEQDRQERQRFCRVNIKITRRIRVIIDRYRFAFCIVKEHLAGRYGYHAFWSRVVYSCLIGRDLSAERRTHRSNLSRSINVGRHDNNIPDSKTGYIRPKITNAKPPKISFIKNLKFPLNLGP